MPQDLVDDTGSKKLTEKMQHRYQSSYLYLVRQLARGRKDGANGVSYKQFTDKVKKKGAGEEKVSTIVRRKEKTIVRRKEKLKDEKDKK